MRTLPIPVLAALISTACAHANLQNDVTASLVAAERAFAADATARTVHEAFVAVLAADATLFRPTPVNGLQALAQRPMRATLSLRWAPSYAETSLDGVYGFTTGPSEYGERGQPPAGTGYFVSVWRRAGGAWKLIVDGGIDAPLGTPLADAPAQLRTGRPTRGQAFSATERRERSLELEELELARGYKLRFEQVADRDVRVMRDGHTPAANRNAGIMLVRQDSDAEYALGKVTVSSTNDFGYAFGTINPRSDHPGSFLRIWRRDEQGNWRVAVDWRS